jgi:hypothetical protein
MKKYIITLRPTSQKGQTLLEINYADTTNQPRLFFHQQQTNMELANEIAQGLLTLGLVEEIITIGQPA